MASKVNDIFQHLFLDQEEPRRPQFSLPIVRSASPESISSPPESQTSFPPSRPVLPSFVRSPSNASSKSSGTSFTNSDKSFGRKASTSTRASSISIPNWQPPPGFVQQFMAAAHNYGYDLPCECFFLGCNLRFNPAQREAWISHSASHFVNAPLPPFAICTFCDEVTFRSQGDLLLNWRERMLHIADHLEDLTPSESMRPDFWVIEHMATYGLISTEDHAHAVKGTERPYYDNTYPLDYELPEILEKKERELEQSYNLRDEERQWRNERKKGKSTHITPSHRPRKSPIVRIE